MIDEDLQRLVANQFERRCGVPLVRVRGHERGVGIDIHGPSGGETVVWASSGPQVWAQCRAPRHRGLRIGQFAQKL